MPKRIGSNNRTLWALIAAGFVARAIVALVADHVYHADEIFQYLEPAHRLVFGYGVVPWEFRFGARTWLPALVVAPVLWICKLVGATDPSLYIAAVKLVFCALSLSLIWSSYSIGRSVAGERAGLCAAFAAAFWYELVYMAHSPLTTNLAAYALVPALACAMSRAERPAALATGALVGLALVLRVHMAPAALVLAIAAWRSWGARPVLRAAIAATVAILLAGGALDWWTWGVPFAGTTHYLEFNVGRGFALTFGTAPVYWYGAAMIVASCGLYAAALAWGVARPAGTWPLTAAALATLASHTMVAGKAWRYMFLVIPLAIVLLAVLVSTRWLERVAPAVRRRHAAAAAFALLAISTLGLLNRLPYQNRLYNWGPLERDPALAFYRELSRRPGVDGVLDHTRHWARTGGYYTLHRDVPLYLSDHVERGVLPVTEAELYVTHVIVRRGPKDAPEGSVPPELRSGAFTLVERRGAVELYERSDVRGGAAGGAEMGLAGSGSAESGRGTRVGGVIVAPGYTRDVHQPGIDGVYTPAVTPLVE
jgi:hypothetical protein